MFSKRGKFLTFVILGLSLFILFDHFVKHDGLLWQHEDFVRAFSNSVNSHEGIVFLLLVLLLGIILVDYHKSQKKH